MRKKICVLIVASLTAISLVGCDGNNDTYDVTTTSLYDSSSYEDKDLSDTPMNQQQVVLVQNILQVHIAVHHLRLQNLLTIIAKRMVVIVKERRHLLVFQERQNIIVKNIMMKYKIRLVKWKRMLEIVLHQLINVKHVLKKEHMS